jgi:hypothetical protein
MSAQTPAVFTPFQRAIAFVLFLAGGLSVFLFGANTFDMFPTNRNPVYEWGITILFFILAWLFKLGRKTHFLWKIALALFLAAFSNALNLLCGNWLGKLLPPLGSAMAELAVDKLSQAIPVIAALTLLTLLSGDNFASIFIQKGNLRRGLSFGLISFAVFGLLFALIALVQSGGEARQGMTASGLSLSTIIAALPWILIFVLTNGLMEELWVRGISLGKLTPVLGSGMSILVTALVFGSMHLGATYVAPLERILFPLITVALGAVNASVMLKSRAIWGSALFHAGYDLLVIIPILAS